MGRRKTQRALEEVAVKKTLAVLGGLAVAGGLAFALAGTARAAPAQSTLPALGKLENSMVEEARRRCRRVCVKRGKWLRCRAWRTRCWRV
jgi:hypothetical protein